ncbi:hypothetical protein CEXT_785231 [Caerostris extrusa]|uniref:Uncharacterized protein n=1 Tax=Caerostris extrusa TaxID=172846 RepID=A0AAV4YBU3_CAEEX|nr:hypothetical protein CEXT_785231 [Caerostris extrusa]
MVNSLEVVGQRMYWKVVFNVLKENGGEYVGRVVEICWKDDKSCGRRREYARKEKCVGRSGMANMLTVWDEEYVGRH